MGKKISATEIERCPMSSKVELALIVFLSAVTMSPVVYLFL